MKTKKTARLIATKTKTPRNLLLEGVIQRASRKGALFVCLKFGAPGGLSEPPCPKEISPLMNTNKADKKQNLTCFRGKHFVFPISVISVNQW